MAFSYSPKIITDGLVLYLDGANSKSYSGTGTTWSDLSRSGLNGTLTNGPTFNSTNGGVIVLDGVNDYVTMGNVLNNVVAGTNNKFTFCSWVFRTGTTTQGPIIAKNADSNLSSNERNVAFSYRNDKFDFVAISKPDFSGWSRLITTNNTYSTGQWYYACCSYDGSINTNNGLDRVKIYVNGLSVAISLTFQNGELTNTMDGSIAQLSIGATVNSTGNSFGNAGGRVASAKIYNRVLSASEILQNYNATKTRFGL